MPTPAETPQRSSVSFSNLQVITILLVAGALLVGVTWIFATDIGRIPVSLWDICTTPVQDTPAAPSSPPSPISVSVSVSDR